MTKAGATLDFEKNPMVQDKVVREAVSEWSRGDASDIDGQTERSKQTGAHESISIARVDGNAARWLAQARGSATDKGKTARVAATEL